LQISEGLDSADRIAGQKLIDDAQKNLTGLVGADKADETIKAMTAWSKQLSLPSTAFDPKPWDVASLQQNVRSVTSECIQKDPVFDQVIAKVKKYKRGKAMMITGSVAESALSVGALIAPGFGLPFAVEGVFGGFVASTGGNESTKLLNELYFAKDMESRWKRLNEESQLSMTAYQSALQKKSPTMLACSESLMCQMVGPIYTRKVLGQLVLPDDVTAEATAIEKAKSEPDESTIADVRDRAGTAADKTGTDADKDNPSKSDEIATSNKDDETQPPSRHHRHHHKSDTSAATVDDPMQ
jgi:hypothetical protein